MHLSDCVLSAMASPSNKRDDAYIELDDLDQPLSPIKMVMAITDELQEILELLVPSGPSDSEGSDDTLYWITVGNIDDNVYFSDIVKAFFRQCIRVSRDVSQRNVFHVAFGSREDAEAAISLYENNIKMFERVWRFQYGITTVSMEQQESSHVQVPPEMEGLDADTVAGLQEIFLNEAIGTHEATKVRITGVDTRVPAEVFEPIFATVGRVTSHEVLRDDTGTFQGRVEVEYERPADAVAAVQHFFDNITVFGQTWQISREPDGSDF